MGHGDDGARIVGQMPLQPGHAFGVEVVRRFVEQQQVGLFEQDFAQGHAPLFAARKLVDCGIARRQIHRVHGDFDLPVEFPGVVQLDLVLDLGLLVEQFFHFVGLDRIGQPGVDLVEAAENFADRLDGFLDVAEDVAVGIQLRLLRQIAGRETGKRRASPSNSRRCRP